MSTVSLIAEVAQLGITLWVEDGVIRYRPKSAMTPELGAKLKANRDEVLEALASAAGKVIPASADEIRFWLDCLRDAGCRIELRDDVPTIDWAAGMATPGRLSDWQANLPVIMAVLQAESERLTHRPTKQQRREPPSHPLVVPKAILASPRIVCPACSSRPVLPDLCAMTGGRCYSCWGEGRS